MTKALDYGEALTYLRNLPNRDIPQSWAVFVCSFEDLPEDVRQSTINRLIGIHRGTIQRKQEKLNLWREKYGGDEE